LKVTVFYIGTSLLAPLKTAEREINRELALELEISAHNFGAALSDDSWAFIERDLSESEIVFVIHVMDGENAARLLQLLEVHRSRHRAVIVINCMPDLMRRTRMGKLDFKRFGANVESEKGSSSAVRLLGTVGSWLGNQAKARRNGNHSHTRYLKLADRLPGLALCSQHRCAARCEELSLTLLLFPAANTCEHSIDGSFSAQELCSR